MNVTITRRSRLRAIFKEAAYALTIATLVEAALIGSFVFSLLVVAPS
jgi:hypothetical protein